jgi:hypothetical protein
MRVVGPVVAGAWYPADPKALADLVDALFERTASQRGDAGARAVVAPHAGFVYSGQVAAQAMSVFRRRGVRRVLLLGPSHYVGFRGAALPDVSALRTPLGDVPVDDEALKHLRAHPLYSTEARPWAREHSLESELPFLQRALEEGWSVLPVLIGPYSDAGDLDALADALRPWADDDTLVVASSDFTHYGRGFGYVPFASDIETRLRSLDQGAIDRIESGEARAFDAYCDATGATICGRHAIGVLLRLWPEGLRGRLTAYDTSGRMTGDFTHTVSYAGIVLARGTA